MGKHFKQQFSKGTQQRHINVKSAMSTCKIRSAKPIFENRHNNASNFE